MIPFNFHHLYYFYTLSKEGSVTSAAKKLRIGQPALSFQIKQFENFLGFRLFNREGKKLTLSEEGQHLKAYAEDIFETGREMMQSLGTLSKKGRLKTNIGATPYVPKSFLDALLNFILKLEPEQYLTLHEERMEKLAEMLDAHEIDFILTDMPYADKSRAIESYLIEKVPVVFIAHPSISKKLGSFPGCLEEAPMILPTSNSQIYLALQEYFISHKIKPKVVAEIQDVEIVRRLVLNKAGIAPINQYTLMHAPSNESLVVLNKKPLGIYRSVFILAKKRKKAHPLLDSLLSKFHLTD